MSAYITLHKPPIQQCTKYQKMYRIGELVCPHCGTPIVILPTGRTRPISDVKGKTANDTRWTLQPPNVATTAIIFIEDKTIALPMSKSLIIGRLSKDL